MLHKRTYEIIGGNPVSGSIGCQGTKNFATKALVATLLSEDISVLTNIPKIGEVDITLLLLESAGAKVKWLDETTVEIDARKLSSPKISMPDSRTNRIPILLLGVLLHRFGEANVPIVGGDDIGVRKIDFHLQALEKFGGKVETSKGGYLATAKRLKGCHIHLPYPSVGATESCLYLSVLAEGTTVIHNVAVEPEIMELIAMLRSMGAIIFTSSNREITVKGVEKLHGTRMHIIGDRLEVASWASLACASEGDITVTGCRPETLGNFLSYFSQVGGGFEFKSPDSIRFFRRKKLTSIVIETDVFPGFSTDWQQTFAVLLTQADGVSVIHETVYEQRFGYLNILNALGAKTQVVTHCLGALQCRYTGFDHPHSAIITGPTPFIAPDYPLLIPDLRAGLAYIIAAAMAKGKTVLHAVEQVERGYGDLSKRLSPLGLDIKAVNG